MDTILLWGSSTMADRKGIQWRLIVFQRGCDASAAGFGPFTAFQWRSGPDHNWKDQEVWPAYNPDNGQTAGLPVVTRDLYEFHRPTLDAMLATKRARRAATEPTPEGLQYVMPGCEKDRTRGPAQLSLF